MDIQVLGFGNQTFFIASFCVIGERLPDYRDLMSNLLHG